MAKMLAFHSYKGDAGKTFLSVNTAGMLAKMGNKVCLLDFDFHAPSLLALFKVNRPRAWVNDFLAGKYEIQKAIVELDSKNDSTGRLFVGFANPNFRAILAMNDADKRKELQVLEKILALRRELFEIESFDYVLLDAGPGLNYSSVNAIVASDFAVLVTTLDLSYTEGTARMIRDIYRVLEKKFGLLINKAFDVSTKAKKIEVKGSSRIIMEFR